MLSAMDKERLVKAAQSANLFVQDLQDLEKTNNPLLVDVVEDMLKQVKFMEQRLLLIEQVAHADVE